MIKECFRKKFAQAFYPTRKGNWYKNKGYKGEGLQEQFIDFVNQQKKPGAIFFEEFKSLKLKRKFISSGQHQLDSVIITPEKRIAQDKPGFGKYFVLFQGRGEYYESRFRDMANQAKAIGANIVGFNPKGFFSSSGKTEVLADIVHDGIAVVDHLLKSGVQVHDIILQGNSLGAGVQEMVFEHFRNSQNISLRQINSNSFKNLAIIVAQYYRLPFLEYFFKILLTYSGWEIAPGPNFYKTGPYKMYLRRKNDRTIKGKAEFHSMINHENDYNASPEGYKETNKWLNEHNCLVYNGRSKKDPHELSLSLFSIDEEESRSVFHMISLFVEESDKFIGHAT